MSSALEAVVCTGLSCWGWGDQPPASLMREAEAIGWPFSSWFVMLILVVSCSSSCMKNERISSAPGSSSYFFWMGTCSDFSTNVPFMFEILYSGFYSLHMFSYSLFSNYTLSLHLTVCNYMLFMCIFGRMRKCSKGYAGYLLAVLQITYMLPLVVLVSLNWGSSQASNILFSLFLSLRCSKPLHWLQHTEVLLSWN